MFWFNSVSCGLQVIARENIDKADRIHASLKL